MFPLEYVSPPDLRNDGLYFGVKVLHCAVGRCPPASQRDGRESACNFKRTATMTALSRCALEEFSDLQRLGLRVGGFGRCRRLY